MKILLIIIVLCAFSMSSLADSQAQLVGFASLESDTFLPGPPSGQFDGKGHKARQPRFTSQPVQGISAIRPSLNQQEFWALSDNGFGSKENSPDYLLRIHLLSLQPKTSPENKGNVSIKHYINLRDPFKKIPFLIVNEHSKQRVLTGWDFDPESLVVAPDQTFWIGDEFGPFLLHFDSQGRLMEPPYEVPEIDPESKNHSGVVRSPQNPAIFNISTKKDIEAITQIKQSSGFEGLAFNKKNNMLYALLEGSVVGDPEELLRIYEFDLNNKKFTGNVYWYKLESTKHKIGEIAVIRDKDFLVIERDNFEGSETQFKKIYKIHLDSKSTVVQKTEVLDLLNISDSENISGYGPNFRFPYVTIESVWPVSPDTLLVCNDNNYPRTGGRGDDVKDVNEFIWVKLGESLY